MVIRNLQKRRISLKGLLIIVILCILAILAMMKIFKMQNQNAEISENINEDVLNYRLGTPVSISGTIRNDNNFPHYTHILQKSNNKIFGLKSSLINLNNFSGMIEIAGYIDVFYKNMPIIEVNSVKIPKQNLVITKDSYMFTDDLLRFDFGEQIGFNAQKHNQTIDVYFNNTKLASYERFVCNKVVKTHNCEQIIQDLHKTKTENFVSYDGDIYYRYGSGKRITFNDKIFGYIVSTNSDERILDLSTVTRIIDKSFIIENKKNIIQSQCQSGAEKFLNITDYQYQQLDNRRLQITAFGSTNEYYKSSCKVIFDLWNKWNITEAKLIHLDK